MCTDLEIDYDDRKHLLHSYSNYSQLTLTNKEVIINPKDEDQNLGQTSLKMLYRNDASMMKKKEEEKEKVGDEKDCRIYNICTEDGFLPASSCCMSKVDCSIESLKNATSLSLRP